MTRRRETVEAFSSCFRVLSKIDRVKLGLNDFLKKFIDFLGGQPNADKFLLMKINHLSDFMLTFCELKVIPQKLALSGYKELLRLKLRVIKTSVVEKREVKSVRPKLSTDPGLKETEKEVLDFVNSKIRVQNTEIFSQFRDLHSRSIKRHLSNLVKKGLISREARGKTVIYTKSNKND